MKKKLCTLLTVLLMLTVLVPAMTETAHAGDLDYIADYEVRVTPQQEDGSLRIQVDLLWEVLEDGPVNKLQVGIPNGSIRDVEAISSNIESLDYDNSYMYIEFKKGYDTGALFSFSYAWTQEYMYTMPEEGGIMYDYTPGWFDEAKIGAMSVTWMTPEGLRPVTLESTCDDAAIIEQEQGEQEGRIFTTLNLPHGARMNVRAVYTDWPGELYWEDSAENLPPEYEGEEDDDWATVAVLVALLTLYVIYRIARSYQGGFGTRYVYVHGLWYPAGLNGKPRPGSTGTKHKPKPPRGGMGGGSRGGGFGSSGFGGGGHCACASSCACACACACAGGGRAGCSAKNLYGAVKLSRELTEKQGK